MEPLRIAPSTLLDFAAAVFARRGVPRPAAQLAAQSLLDASLMGIDSHGIESLEMYVAHLEGGGLDAGAEPVCVGGRGRVESWDMQHGFGLASGRQLMAHAVRQAQDEGIHLITCRNANHLGACGVYAKIAADAGMVGIVSQQTLASLAPWGGREGRVGTSPFALVAPVQGRFPFYFDASMAAITRHQIKTCRGRGEPLPEGVALDAEGNPTRDPEKAWLGQIMPIGGHKGVGLAMALEVLTCILSGNRFSTDVPSIVNRPDRSAGSGVLMIAIDPGAVMPSDEFGARMRRYVEHVESSPAREPGREPRYPGAREGSSWADRARNGIPVSGEVVGQFEKIAVRLGVAWLSDASPPSR